MCVHWLWLSSVLNFSPAWWTSELITICVYTVFSRLCGDVVRTLYCVCTQDTSSFTCVEIYELITKFIHQFVLWSTLFSLTCVVKSELFTVFEIRALYCVCTQDVFSGALLSPVIKLIIMSSLQNPYSDLGFALSDLCGWRQKTLRHITTELLHYITTQSCHLCLADARSRAHVLSRDGSL